jgi:hypothetical protein
VKVQHSLPRKITIKIRPDSRVQPESWNGACEGQDMLSTQQKAVILRKAGMALPPFPRRHPQPQDGDQAGEASASQRQLVAGHSDSGDAAEDAQEAAFDAWSKVVRLYADYALACAAHSLGKAEHARIRGGS